jgi:hypothetical protein
MEGYPAWSSCNRSTPPRSPWWWTTSSTSCWPGAEGIRRFPLAYDAFDGDQLVAEHGFSALVTIESGGRRSSILYDGGWKATHRLAQALPDAFVQPSVGTVLRF